MLEILGAVALGMVLGEMGLNDNLALAAAWIVNLFTAGYLFKAAQHQGRRAYLYGIFAALAPATAILVFFRLFTYDRDAFWDAASRQHQDGWPA